MPGRGLTVFTLALGLGWAAPLSSGNSEVENALGPPGWRYETAPVAPAVLTRYVTASGALTSEVNVDVGSQLSGQIDRVCVDFNDEVKKGQLLAELDRRGFAAQYDGAQATLDVAKAQVAVAEAKLARAKADYEQARAQGDVLNARVQSASITLDAANRVAERKATLTRTGSVSAAEAQDALARSAVALASLREAQSAFATQQKAIDGASADAVRAEAELTGAKAEVARTSALVDAAKLELSRTEIRSPIDGVIVGRNISAGETLAATLESKTLFVVSASLKRMEVRARVDESDIAQIQPGETATFSVDAFPHRQFPATVKQVRKAPIVEQNVVTYVVVLTASNDDLSLLPGMTAVARIETFRAATDKSVPLSALRFRPLVKDARQEGEGKPALWVLRNGLPREVGVKLGAQDADRAEVEGDIRPGDLVLTGERRRLPARAG